MTTRKRIIVIIAQLVTATIVGYIAAFGIIMAITDSFVIGLILIALIGGLVIVGIGLLFGMRGQWWMALIGAVVGVAVSYAILQTPFAVANAPLWLALALIP